MSKTVFGPVDWSTAALRAGRPAGQGGAPESSGCGCGGASRPALAPALTQGASQNSFGNVAAAGPAPPPSVGYTGTIEVDGSCLKTLISPVEVEQESGDDDAMRIEEVNLGAMIDVTPGAGQVSIDGDTVLDSSIPSVIAGGLPGWSSRAAEALNEAVNDVCPYAWTTAPDDLKSQWRGVAFDDPDSAWMYAQVVDSASFGFCGAPTDLGQFAPRCYAVCALTPYAVYKIIVTKSGSSEIRFRVRYWVGVVNNFSFYLPPPDVTVGVVPGPTVTLRVSPQTRDLPSEVWDDNFKLVYARGNLATWFTRLVVGTQTSIAWESDDAADHGGGATAVEMRWNLYPCNPANAPLSGSGGVDGATTYANSGGDPSALCFSNAVPVVDATGEMTSFLGESAWGEVCMCLKLEGWDNALPSDEVLAPYYLKAVRRGFRHLFGSKLRAGVALAFFAPNGGRSDVASLPHFFSRHVHISTSNLETVESFVSRMDLKRQTAWSRWLYRITDINALTDAAEAMSKDDGTDGC